MRTSRPFALNVDGIPGEVCIFSVDNSVMNESDAHMFFPVGEGKYFQAKKIGQMPIHQRANDKTYEFHAEAVSVASFDEALWLIANIEAGSFKGIKTSAVKWKRFGDGSSSRPNHQLLLKAAIQNFPAVVELGSETGIVADASIESAIKMQIEAAERKKIEEDEAERIRIEFAKADAKAKDLLMRTILAQEEAERKQLIADSEVKRQEMENQISIRAGQRLEAERQAADDRANWEHGSW